METFEDWVTARFGRRLYDAFFRSYTEKVWGIPGSEIQSEWAAQRIKDFSFRSALLSALHLHASTSDDADRGVPVSAARAGPDVGGVSRACEERGVPVHLNHRASAIQHEHEVVTR